jgi:hypothetical protein
MLRQLDVVPCSDMRREEGYCLSIVDLEKLAFPPPFRKE